MQQNLAWRVVRAGKAVFVNAEANLSAFTWIAVMVQNCATREMEHGSAKRPMVVIHNFILRNFVLAIIIITMLATCRHRDDFPTRELAKFNSDLVFDYSQHDLDIFDPHRILLAPEGLYIASKNAQLIRLIDIKTGDIIREYGVGKGRGPGEHENLMEFDVSDSYVSTIDHTLMRVTVFDKSSGSIVHTAPLKRTPTWMVNLGNVHISSTIMSDSLFYLSDSKTDSIISSSSILNLDTSKEYGLSMPGRYIVFKNRFLYFPIWDRRVFEINYDTLSITRGRIFDSQIDTFSFKPSLDMSSENQAMVQAPKSRYSRSGIARSGNVLYQLVHLFGFHPNQRYQTYLDVYDLDLNYLYSYGDLHDLFFPDGVQSITAHDDTLCFKSNENVLCYAMTDDK